MIAVALIAAVVFWLSSAEGSLTTLAAQARLRSTLVLLGTSEWDVAVVLAAFVIGSLIAFPVTVLIGGAAIVLGPMQGFLWAFVGTMLGAGLSYLLGRGMRRAGLNGVLGVSLARIDRRLARRGLVTVAVLRNVPFAPFTIVNLLMGASSVRMRDYLLGTAIGMLPGIAAITVLGDRLALLWQQPDLVNLAMAAMAVVLWLAILLYMQRLADLVRR